MAGFLGGNEEPKPASEEAESAEGSDSAKNSNVRESEGIKGTGENQNSGYKAERWTAAGGFAQGEEEEGECVGHMIKDGGIPNVSGGVPLKDFLEAMSAKRAQRHGGEAGQGGDAQDRTVCHEW